jgi:hypothetical protein
LPLESKQTQFNAAMARYDNRRTYGLFGNAVSVVNISLQAYLLYKVLPLSIGPWRQALVLLAAWILTDFINGLVHMIMDNSDRYESAAGPLVAAFHLHHKTPVYRKNPLPIVYFNETGSKVWLVFYLSGAALLLNLAAVPPALAYLMVYFGILSSVAEVSHYLCHRPEKSVLTPLSRVGILMSKSHHARHHTHDNTRYAFLNGMTDPLLNVIAGQWFGGYKKTTDLHYAAYSGPGTENR